jgi:hypothetical protein
MSYYFPFRGSEATEIQSIGYALSAVTASIPLSTAVTAITASYAVSSGSNPPAGASGVSVTQFACEQAAIINPKLLVSGSTGLQGPTGSKGADNVTCPGGTIECTALNVSLSMALPGFPSGINFIRPSGSQFSKVCMEIPPGCTSANAVCPPYLPTASITANYPSIP